MTGTQLKSIVSAAVAALSLSGMATAAESSSLRGIDLRAYGQTIARDDRDAAPAIQAIPVCEMGFRTQEFANPGAACGVAYEYATREKKYEQALRYAALGCEKHKSVESCRNVGALPLSMGNQGIPVPVSFKAELKRVAEFVCYSGARIKAINGVDVTGRECGYLARRFNLAKDPEYAFALEPAARRFFEAIHEPARAVRLYKIACEHWGYASSCNSSVEVGQRVNLRDLAEVNEIIDRERGAMPVSAAAVAQRINLRDHAEVTEIIEREAGAALVDAAAIASGFAYDGALGEGKFEQALRYAVTGCEKHKDANQCRQVADLPVHVGNRGIPPAPLFAAEVKRMADFVCLSGNRVKDGGGDDVTGRICDHFALQFVMAKDRDSSQALSPTARQYLNLIYQPTRAGKLFKAACERHAYSSSC